MVVQLYQFYGRSFYVKREDLLHPVLGGNKFRKAWFLLFKTHPIAKIVSYGSLHSNAMAALAWIALQKGWEFEYYAPLDQKLLQCPKGNLAKALQWGMILKEKKEWPYGGNLGVRSELEYINGTYIIPEGLRLKEAQEGVAILAKEIVDWAKKERKSPTVFLPSGTGTTALFLQKYLPFRVYTTPCVGDEAYLWEQFEALDPTAPKPAILSPPKKYRFGRLYPELFALWQELKTQMRVTFDLLYDPVGFATLLHHDLLNENLLYIHQGGIMGNETMIERYKAKLDKIAKTNKGAI